MAIKRKEQIGDCTLYLGDCLEVMPTLGARRPHCHRSAIRIRVPV